MGAEAYETAEKIVKKSEEYWSDWTLEQKVSVVTNQKKRANAEINPLQTEMQVQRERGPITRLIPWCLLRRKLLNVSWKAAVWINCLPIGFSE